MLPPIELLQLLKNENNFIIATHINPDGDGLGSSIALSMALQAFGKRTILLCRDPVPWQYKFLPGQERLFVFKEIQHTGYKAQDFKNLILVDCNDIDRITDSKDQDDQIARHLTAGSRLSTAVIDHHGTEKSFGDIRWVRPDSAATGLMLFYLIRELGIKITAEIAINLYAAIATDTGNFRFKSTTPEVLRVAADLVEAGAKPYVIYEELFGSWSRERFALFTKVLGTLRTENGIAVTKVTREMLEETLTTHDDTEHFVGLPMTIKGTKVSALFKEVEDNYYKVSLRSRDDINVAQIAELFGGGGHKNAAGYKIKADIESAEKRLLNTLAHSEQ
ncbi:MAG: bifunctional oligoribonuclease/PAP phosphatase NrnA [Thermodesulfovibrionales bacterium]|nr:bifunctional oligoribonuclease/PAP phosphatase NrnA [Thermodesulfovibrionales bacterium]